MDLRETVKGFFTKTDKLQKELDKSSSEVQDDKVLHDLSGADLYPTTGAFFDGENLGIYGNSDKADKLEKQKAKIMQYRNLSKTPDVNDAIEEIVNETIFNLSGTETITIDIDEENDKIKDKITEKFNKVLKLLNVNKNLYNIVRNTYVDGQIKIHCVYDEQNTKNGMKALKMVEPVYLYFDKKKDVYKYYNKKNADFFHRSSVDKKQEYSREEIVSGDFGIYENDLNLSYLEFAVKTANQLRTLEDLLIPMRFSRSISRRIFNVDIGDLPSRKGESVMQEMQNKFKYKKFYNADSGEVTNQQHITSMVEDYWFANRSGGKGTQVDTLDETGNLGELNDILYFNRKLYKSLYIPSNRISIDPEADKTFDYDSTQATQEDIKFFMFINRIRKVFIEVFHELLRRELISTGTLSNADYDEYKDKIEIEFSSENSFIEKMNLNNFMAKLDILATVQEYSGKFFSYEMVLKDVFKWDDERIKEEMEKIQKEKTNPLFQGFYANPDGEDQW